MKPRATSLALRWLGTAVLGAATGALAWVLLREPPAGARGVRVDLDDLRRRLAAVAGTDAVRIRHLGPGIVELVGRVERADLVPTLLAEASDTGGVDVVVNRLWSPGKPRIGAPKTAIDDPRAARYSSGPGRRRSGASSSDDDASGTTETGRDGG